MLAYRFLRPCRRTGEYDPISFCEAAPPSAQREAQPLKKNSINGKAEPYRTVGRQGRTNLFSPHSKAGGPLMSVNYPWTVILISAKLLRPTNQFGILGSNEPQGIE
jgi:hypothetical protein